MSHIMSLPIGPSIKVLGERFATGPNAVLRGTTVLATLCELLLRVLRKAPL
jgi:hypothetical protein